MAWSSRIVQSQRSDNDKRRALITIRYTDGTLNDTRVHTVASIADLRAQVRGALAEYEAMSALILDVPPNGPFDPAEPIVPPTQAEIDAIAWANAYRRVQSLKRGVANGVAAIAQKDVDDATAALNALPYLSEYEARL
jgi:hypothetical protein